MRALTAFAMIGSLFVSDSVSAATVPPLAPGKAAGIKQADIEGGGVLLVLGVLGVAAAIALIAQGTQGNGGSSTGTQ